VFSDRLKVMKKIQFKKLLAAILLCEGVGLIGSFFTISAIPSWYLFLNKPFFSPPNWLFGPVWTLLYLLMGISLYWIWVKKPQVLKIFWLQLFLNGIWTPIFFGLRSPLLGLLIILFLLLAIILTIKTFYKIYPPAGLILIPYLAWVSFATLLNLGILLLN